MKRLGGYRDRTDGDFLKLQIAMTVTKPVFINFNTNHWYSQCQRRYFELLHITSFFGEENKFRTQL